MMIPMRRKISLLLVVHSKFPIAPLKPIRLNILAPKFSCTNRGNKFRSLCRISVLCVIWLHQLFYMTNQPNLKGSTRHRLRLSRDITTCAKELIGSSADRLFPKRPTRDAVGRVRQRYPTQDCRIDAYEKFSEYSTSLMTFRIMTDSGVTLGGGDSIFECDTTHSGTSRLMMIIRCE